MKKVYLITAGSMCIDLYLIQAENKAAALEIFRTSLYRRYLKWYPEYTGNISEFMADPETSHYLEDYQDVVFQELEADVDCLLLADIECGSPGWVINDDGPEDKTIRLF